MEMSLPPAVRAISDAHSGPVKAALVVTPHPLTLQGQRVLDAKDAPFEPGETLLALLERHGVKPGEQWVVSIEGARVPEAMWSRTRPVEGWLIEARRVPEKDALRLIAYAVLSYYTFGAGGMGAAAAGGGSFLGFTGVAGWVAAGAAFVAGSMVLNKALAPKGQSNRSDQTASPTYSLSGGRNRMRAYEPMGLVLGEPYSVPDLAAQPYTFFASGEQYLWQMFHLGINCADVHTLRIGQTSLDSYQNVTVLRNGLATGNSDFPGLGTSVDSVAGGALTVADGAVTRTSSANTVRLEIDLVASVFYMNSDGSLSGLRLDVLAEYRAVGSGTWLPFTPYVPGVPAVTQTVTGGPTDDSGGPITTWTEVLVPGIDEVPAGYIRQTGASQKPMRITKECAVAPGQYEVRLRKITADSTATNVSSTVEWVQLKSYQLDTANYDGQSRLAVRIQASGQLNGALDEFNCQKRAKPMPYWNGSSWVTATDRASGLCNPGAIFLLLARGIRDSGGRLLAGLGYSDDQIDIAGLQRFMVHCAEKGFHFDLDLQSPTSVDELLDSIAYAGMAEKAWPDGKLGVSIFRSDDPIESVINMGSIKARSFQVDYATMPTAEEIEVQYFDRARGNTWQPVRVQAPGTTPLREPGRVTLVGVTGEAHAAMLARFAMAQNIYQRKSISCEQDLEYMTHRKGSVVSLSHDLTQWGYSGRLAGFQNVAGTITLTLDERAPADNPTGGPNTRFIALQLPGEQQVRVFPVASFVGESRTVTLAAAWPSGVTQPGNDASNPVRDTKWIYDFKAVPGKRLRMLNIEPSVDGAREVMVEEPDEFWDYVETGDYQPPPNNSLLATVPVVTRAFPSEELARQGNTYYTEISLNFEVEGVFSRAELWGAVGPGNIAPPLALLSTSKSQTLSWRGGLDERWHIELRVYSDTRAADPFRIIYDVQGLREPPAPFDVFAVLAQPDGTRQFNFAYTTTEAPLDWLGAEIRYMFGAHTTPAWDDMQPLQVERSYYTASPVEINQLLSGVHTFACRSLDTTGNTSTLKYFQLDLPPRRLGNTVAEYNDRSEGWTGALSSCEVNEATGGIEAASSTTWTSLTTWNDWTRWNMNPADPIVYTSPVRDLSAVLTCLVDATAQVEGDATIELRASETSNDPVADPGEWTAWGPADVKVVARFIQLRVTVDATVGDPIPMINSLSYVVSAPLLNDYINDIDISTLTGSYRIGAGDVRVPMPNTYGTLLELQVVIQDASAGTWSWQVLDKTLTYGPRVQFKLNGVLADPDLVDFIVKGF